MTLRRSVEWKLHGAELALLRRAHPLRYLFLEVTRRCNLACAYCGSACNGAAQGTELPIHEWVAVVREIAEDFDASKVMVAVTGGEPLVKEGIFDLFAELNRLGFPYGMVCNGQLLDADVARRLVASGMRSISLSMDAPPALNDELRGRGTSTKVEKAVGNLKAAGYRGKLEIITTVTTPAIPQLEQMRRFVAELQVPLWRVSPVMPIGRAAQRTDLVPDGAGLRRILEFVFEARKDGRLPVPEMSEEGFLGEKYEKQVRSYLWNCLAGITIAGVLCDGRIGACPELGEAFVQGDVHRDRFADVWRDRYQVFRDRAWAKKGACTTCGEFARCQGGSLHLYASPDAAPLRCLYLDAVRP
jgi:radical SAM protein with 4Fe4S-binding SPASM domain